MGEKLDVRSARDENARQLSSFTVELESDRRVSLDGRAQDVLGGPLDALKFLVEEIARYPIYEPPKAGEIVTTGTLTEAMPAVSGETWTARFQGIGFKPLQVRFS